MDLQELIHHILKNYEPNELEEVLACEMQGLMDAQEARMASLCSILTDPANQLEVTKGGYYIYRFSLQTMHWIASALDIANPGKLYPQKLDTPDGPEARRKVLESLMESQIQDMPRKRRT